MPGTWEGSLQLGAIQQCRVQKCSVARGIILIATWQTFQRGQVSIICVPTPHNWNFIGTADLYPDHDFQFDSVRRLIFEYSEYFTPPGRGRDTWAVIRVKYLGRLEIVALHSGPNQGFLSNGYIIKYGTECWSVCRVAAECAHGCCRMCAGLQSYQIFSQISQKYFLSQKNIFLSKKWPPKQNL